MSTTTVVTLRYKQTEAYVSESLDGEECRAEIRKEAIARGGRTEVRSYFGTLLEEIDADKEKATP